MLSVQVITESTIYNRGGHEEKKMILTIPTDMRETIKIGLIITMLFITFLAVTGCDEGMQMGGGVITEPTEEPTDPTTNGEVKQPEELSEPVDPAPVPTVEIGSTVQEDNGSITISGVSTNVPKGTVVTVTLGGTVTTTAITSESGEWTVAVPKAQAETLPAGTATVTATVAEATDTSSLIVTKPTPTVEIAATVQEDDGSVTVSGASTNVPSGTAVTVTLGGTVTTTATTDASGKWTATIPAAEAEVLSDGTVTVTATAADATADSSFEYTVQTTYGIPTPTEEDRVKVELYVDVVDPEKEGKVEFVLIYEGIDKLYGSQFDLETEVGRETFKRFAEYSYKQIKLSRSSPTIEERLRILDQLFEEAYGISAEYARWLVYEVYLQEKPEDSYLLGIRWQKESIAMEHLLLRIDNPNATEEEILALLRESIRAGRVTIASRG